MLKHSSFLYFGNVSFVLFLYFFKGENIGQNEATKAFFAMTKLFQSQDVSRSNS